MKNRQITTLFSALLFSATVSLQAGYASMQAPGVAPQAEHEQPAEVGPHKNKLDRKKGDAEKRKQGDVDKKRQRANDKLRKKDKPQKGGVDKPGRTGGADLEQLQQTLMKLKVKRALLQRRLDGQGQQDLGAQRGGRDFGPQRQALRGGAQGAIGGRMQERMQAGQGNAMDQGRGTDRQAMIQKLRERMAQRGQQMRLQRGAEFGQRRNGR